MYELFYWPTPNGKKVTVLLEECGLEYKITPVNIQKGDQFNKDFLRMNPNHRMPVMVDHKPKDGGAPISVFESGAIMMYIAEKVGKFWPQDTRTKYEVTEWLIWQMANQGPKLGEAGHFRRLGDREGDQKYAVNRFTDEANRLYGVLNNRLANRPWLAGKEYTIADMICYPWTVNHKVPGPGPRGVQARQALGRGDRQAARRAEGHGRRRQPVHRRHQAATRGAGPHPQADVQSARHSGGVTVLLRPCPLSPLFSGERARVRGGHKRLSNPRRTGRCETRRTSRV